MKFIRKFLQANWLSSVGTLVTQFALSMKVELSVSQGRIERLLEKFELYQYLAVPIFLKIGSHAVPIFHYTL